MEQIQNRFGLPVQSGEFIHIQNGVCHILNYVEEWEDAPEDTSGYRGVFLYGLEIGKLELRARIINDRGFAELDSEYKQSIAEEPLTQEVFDIWIDYSNNPDLQFKPITVRQFCERIMTIDDGCYFVKFARGCLYPHEVTQIEREWCEFKIREKLPKPDAGTASNWIDEWLSTHPELDAPWIVDEMITQISFIEEPGEWNGKNHPFVGKKVFIRKMKGEPQYTGKTGVVTLVDDAGQIHGTWGGCALTVDDDYDFVESGDGQGALRAPSTPGDASGKAPYEDYRETEVFGEKANKSLLELVSEHRTRNHVDIVMSEWISAIDDADAWDLDEAESEPEGLFELIMTLETMYRDYGSDEPDRHDFAYQVSELMSTGKTLDEIRKDPKDLYIRLESMYD